MFLDLLVGIFSMSNAFIALFIVIYAFLFLRKTKSHKERRPWDYLFIASIIYLLYSMLIMILQIYQVKEIFGLNVFGLSIFFQFLYTGLILLSFISQTDLIFKNEIIIITRKLDPAERKEIETGNIDKLVHSEEKKIEAEVKKDLKEDIEEEIAKEVPMIEAAVEKEKRKPKKRKKAVKKKKK